MSSEVDHVARVLCDAAGRTITGVCSCCERDDKGVLRCQLWYTFRSEAEAAIRAYETYKKVTSAAQHVLLNQTKIDLPKKLL